MFQTLLDEITKRAKGVGFLAVELQGVLVLIDLAGPFDPASDRELNIARNPRPRLAELDCRNARKRNALIALEAVIEQIGRASCRERVGQYVKISVGAGAIKKKKHRQKQ